MSDKHEQCGSRTLYVTKVNTVRLALNFSVQFSYRIYVSRSLIIKIMMAAR